MINILPHFFVDGGVLLNPLICLMQLHIISGTVLSYHHLRFMLNVLLCARYK